MKQIVMKKILILCEVEVLKHLKLVIRYLCSDEFFLVNILHRNSFTLEPDYYHHKININNELK